MAVSLQLLGVPQAVLQDGSTVSLRGHKAWGLLAYLEDTQKTVQAPLQPLTTYTLSAYLVIDHQSRRNL